MAKVEITQALLRRIETNKAQIKELEKSVEADEATLLVALRGAHSIQSGLLTAEIKISERRTTAWKETAIAFVDETRGAGEGEKWAARVIAATKPTASEKAVVKFAAKA
jgi:hypothetical protein